MSSPPPFKRSKTATPPDLNNHSHSKNSENMQSNGGERDIDEGLYSRQLYVLGTEGMRRMANCSVLVSGLNGLGVEIAKNVVLAGVNSVTLHDPNPVGLSDLSSHFFVTAEDIGRNLAVVCKDKLAELNSHVTVDILDKDKLCSDDIQNYTVVVLTQASHETCLELGDVCHARNIKLVVASTCGVFGKVFCDFGEEFIVYDSTGDEPPSVLVQQIEKSTEGLVTCLEETRHEFQEGDYVTFSEVKGMVELNGCEPRRIKVIGPDAFSIGDTSGLSDYISGGSCRKVKMPEKHSYKSYRSAFQSPEFLVTDFVKMERPSQLHLCFKALSDYRKEQKGAWPGVWSQKDAGVFVEFVKRTNEEMKGCGACVDAIDEKLCALFSFTCCGQCSPLQAVIGGFAAQEVMKACTGKFVPLNQWCYFDAIECLPSPKTSEVGEADHLDVIGEGDAAPRGGRYDGQIAIFGQQFQEKLLSLNTFMVGAGAIGCELLKNFALMGVGAGSNGRVVVTDMDSIERSNLNRQFLFRPWDISKMKSVVAARAVKVMNPEMNIVAHENRVCAETEKIYDDSFFDGLNFVVNALDNVEARVYVDRRCVYSRKPLLESGTLGTKGNVQVVLPYLTESYSSSQDPPEKSFPVCTLKNFPYLIEHTLQWARDLFEGVFANQSQSVSSYLKDPAKFIERTMSLPGNQPVETLNSIKDCLIENRPKSFADCVKWARLQFQDLFHNTIAQLLFNFPPDHVTMSGSNFWSGTKRCPHPLEFDINNSMHLDFVISAANLRAHIFGIPECRSVEQTIPMIEAVDVPPFKPKTGVRIEVNEADVQNNGGMSNTADSRRLKELQNSLSSFKNADDFKVNVVEFEKDDDTNFHMDYIVSASNLRAACYDIAPADRLKSKLIAGKIIPAIATTTSMIAGLVCLELYKLVQGHKSLSYYKNAYINLAEPFFAFFEPVPPEKLKYYDTEFSLWDRFELSGPMTLREFIDYFKNEHKLEVTMVSYDVSLVYTFLLSKDKLKERMSMQMDRLVETVSKKPIPPHAKALVFSLCCNDETGEDVEVPYVRYMLNSRST